MWSLALRRRERDLSGAEKSLVREWADLVREGRALLIGAVRQEVLSGIRAEAQFERLRDRLSDFEDISCGTPDHEEAARLFNRLRASGITGSPIDLLICAVASRVHVAIFTTDPDFEVHARHLPIRLHVPRPA